MRRTVIFALLAGASLLLPRPAWAAPPKTLGWSLDAVEVTGRGDSLAVALTWTFSDWNVAPTKAMVFSPSIRKGNSFASLTPVSVYGRKTAQPLRQKASGNNGEMSVLDVSRPVRVRTLDVIPLQDWMDTVKVTLAVSEWSKRDGLVLRSTSQRGVFLKPEKPADFVFPWDDREPRRDSQPFGELSFSVPVRFAGAASTKFDPSEGTDAYLLEEFLRKVKVFTSDGLLKLRSSALVVTVPPEGVARESVKISRGRAASLYSYLAKKGAFRIRSVTTSRVGGGEDWEGVREWVSATRYGGDQRLMEILSWDGKSDAKAGAIRSEKPVVWDILTRECFPSLGKATYEVSFVRPGFDNPARCREMYDRMPEVLTAHDFWYLAESYGLGTDQWLEVVCAGADLHPEDPALNLDAAFGLMEAGRGAAAAPYLRNADGDPGFTYAFAVWLFRMERYEECIALLQDLGARSTAFDAVLGSAVPFIRWKMNRVPWARYYP